MPKYSIILPVYNGGEYAKICVNSVLAQTLQDFELLVLDNCSTDGTREWIESLDDERIRIFPSQQKLTIEENWARVKTIPRMEWMTCIGHDDVLLPGYLEEINNLLQLNPGASVLQTHFTYIDPAGDELRKCKPMESRMDALKYLEKILTINIDINGTGYMVRTKVYDEVGGIPPYPSLLFADYQLWLESIRKSSIAVSANYGFEYRLHNSTTSVSRDDTFQRAFKCFIDYLVTLKTLPAFNAVINAHAHQLIGFYCKSLAHRLLRTPLAERNGISVRSWVIQCRGFADRLIDNNKFDPATVSSVRLALWIDKSVFTRKLFILFKKFYKKPVLK